MVKKQECRQSAEDYRLTRDERDFDVQDFADTQKIMANYKNEISRINR